MEFESAVPVEAVDHETYLAGESVTATAWEALLLVGDGRRRGGVRIVLRRVGTGVTRSE
ncbi:MAG: hypothetical protein ABEH58_06940 [Haloplanus sp.]